MTQHPIVQLAWPLTVAWSALSLATGAAVMAYVWKTGDSTGLWALLIPGAPAIGIGIFVMSIERISMHGDSNENAPRVET